jgi:hypothetical protein
MHEKYFRGFAEYSEHQTVSLYILFTAKLLYFTGSCMRCADTDQQDISLSRVLYKGSNTAFAWDTEWWLTCKFVLPRNFLSCGNSHYQKVFLLRSRKSVTCLSHVYTQMKSILKFHLLPTGCSNAIHSHGTNLRHSNNDRQRQNEKLPSVYRHHFPSHILALETYKRNVWLSAPATPSRVPILQSTLPIPADKTLQFPVALNFYCIGNHRRMLICLPVTSWNKGRYFH